MDTTRTLNHFQRSDAVIIFKDTDSLAVSTVIIFKVNDSSKHNAQHTLALADTYHSSTTNTTNTTCWYWWWW